MVGTITGFPYLPPLFSLGFHYSKWEKSTSADKMMEYNQKFEQSGFPLDVLWMDIPHTDNNEYFVFSKKKFPEAQLEKMKEEIVRSKRKLVVITDPHIRKNNKFKVYNDGNSL